MVHPSTSRQPPATNLQKMAQRDRILIIDDQENNRLFVVATQRSRLQIYHKDKDYVDIQFNF